MSKKNNLLVALVAGVMAMAGVVLVAGGSIPIPGFISAIAMYTIKGTAEMQATSLLGWSTTVGTTTDKTWYTATPQSPLDYLPSKLLLFGWGEVNNVIVFASLDGGAEQQIFSASSMDTIIPSVTRTNEFKFIGGYGEGSHTLKIRTTWNANQHERIDTYTVYADENPNVKTAQFVTSNILR